MRVLHVDLGREMRGGQFQALQLIDELKKRGVEQRFLSPFGEPFHPAKLRADVDLVHAHDARSHTWSAIVARAPLVVSRRVAFPVRDSWLSRWKYRRPALFLAVSQYVAGKLESAGIPRQKIRVVYDGVAALPLSTRDGPIVAPATEDPMKGSDLIRASGVDVTFTSDLPTALRTARALLYITREEGLGSAALLAMSAGVPVIASRLGGLPEIVHHEKTGLLVDNAPECIAQAVQQLGQSEITGWGDAGRAMVHARFLASHMAESTLEAYRSLKHISNARNL